MTVSLKTIGITNGEIRKGLLFHIFYYNLKLMQMFILNFVGREEVGDGNVKCIQ